MKEKQNIKDEMYDLICMLEICRGYTQCDEPDMRSLDNVLWMLYINFLEIYERMDGREERKTV